MWFLVALAACFPSGPSPSEADRRGALLERLDFPVPLAADRAVHATALAELDGYRVERLSYRVFDVGTGFDAVAAAFVPERADGSGVLVAHGHFGQGKSSPEAQEIAHRLARRGTVVLAVDTPGVEEYALAARQIHFDEGAHNRAFLAAGGTSALALQVAVLRAGLDVLEGLGARRLAATGASGGAVQSFYLLLADPRVQGAVMAAYPRLPREARAGGCPCDQLPGWPGPDPAVLALLDRPTLWLSDTDQPRAPGLPASARFEVHEGPHSYTTSMQASALGWLDRLFGRARGGCASPDLHDPVASLDLQGPSLDAPVRIFDLPLAPRTGGWAPDPWPAVPYVLDCAGQGPVVLVGGGGAREVGALQARGFRACRVEVLADESGLAEAVATGRIYADRYGGALLAAARRTGAVAALGVRAWGLAARGSTLPFVVLDPIADIDQVDPVRDPAWVHVPGAWWGSDPLAGALARGDDLALLVGVLAERFLPQEPD